MAAKKKKSDQSGQALIELIVFLPLMFTIYSMISGFAASINGSINQQKVTSAYFYYRVQNNSTIPKPGADKNIYMQWQKFGMYFVGWKDSMPNDKDPIAPCYHITSPMNGTEENCEASYDGDSTQYIRVGTAYGVCGATYGQIDGTIFPLPDSIGASPTALLDEESCLIR